MSGRAMDIAFWNYDRGALLRDGTVRIDEVDPTFHSGRIVTDIFEAMITRRAYDVSELGMTYFLRSMESNGAPFLLIPAFLVRSFRHNAIYQVAEFRDETVVRSRFAKALAPSSAVFVLFA